MTSIAPARPRHRHISPSPVGTDAVGLPIAPRRLTRADDPIGLEYLVEFAHDVRRPLSAISSLGYGLQSGMYGALSEAQAERMAQVQDAMRGIVRLVDDLARLALPGSGARRVHVGTFEVEDVLKCVHSLGRPMVDGRGLRLVARNFAPGRYLGPGGAITRVMLNLVTHAVRCTDSGAVVFGARVVGRVLGQTDLEFFVRDTGPGDLTVTPSERSPDSHASRSTPPRDPQADSNGLGLMISRRLLEAIDTRLEIDSRLGEGDVFRFTLRLPSAD
jgi:signal transduction histidine kinase